MVIFNLRLSDEVNDKIVELAKKDHRSKNSEIEFILSEYAKKREEEKLSDSSIER